MKEEKSKIIRKQYTFTGRVQGVGFRYSAQYLAQGLGVTGWVKNEWDGTVSMEVQGEEEKIDQLFVMINKGTYVVITDIQVKSLPLQEHESGFRVRGY